MRLNSGGRGSTIFFRNCKFSWFLTKNILMLTCDLSMNCRLSTFQKLIDRYHSDFIEGARHQLIGYVRFRLVKCSVV